MGTDPPPPNKKGTGEKQQADKIGPDSVLCDPTTPSLHTPLEHPFHRNNFSPPGWSSLSLGTLRVRLRGETKGWSYPVIVPVAEAVRGIPRHLRHPTLRNLREVTSVPRS